MIGLDTGFFLELLKGNRVAVEVWKTGINNDADLAVSCLSLFEIERLGLKGQLRNSEVVIESVMGMCDVVWLSSEALSHGARLSHGLGVPALDALILASLLSLDCTEILTTDSDLEAYQSNKVRVRNLRKLE
jgi:predicted nucleic acid-binding protein